VSRLAIRRGRSVRAKISGEGVAPGEYFFGFCKTRHILLSNSANCTVLRTVFLTQYRRVSDRRTDRRICYSTCNASIAARCKNQCVHRHRRVGLSDLWEITDNSSETVQDRETYGQRAMMSLSHCALISNSR